jgi:hypothetical protein
MTGPKVMIVSREVFSPSAVIGTGFGLNEQTGGKFTRGVMELHESVIPGVAGVVTGVMYPLIGLMTIVVTPLLPAGTLAGSTAFSTVMVNCGATSSTVMYSGAVVVVWLFEADVPVMVTAYLTWLVSTFVVIVAEALAGGVTLPGLTVHAGKSVMLCACTGATRQVRSTVPLKPLTVPTLMFAVDEPPGSTATSDSEGACSVKLCADASAGKVTRTASRHKAQIPALPARTIRLGFDELGLNDFGVEDMGFDDSDGNGSALNHSDCGNRDFNMSRFRFK